MPGPRTERDDVLALLAEPPTRTAHVAPYPDALAGVELDGPRREADADVGGGTDQRDIDGVRLVVHDVERELGPAPAADRRGFGGHLDPLDRLDRDRELGERGTLVGLVGADLEADRVVADPQVVRHLERHLDLGRDAG